jgi:membrane protease YdiL (CAAX protease family)
VSAFFEPLILYLVLFFPGFSIGLGGVDALSEGAPFSWVRELSRTLSYILPALALIWYMILTKKSLRFSARKLKPKINDAFSFFWGFPGLIVIGVGISLIVTRVSPFSVPGVQAPVNAAGWIVMVFSCIGTGYLEESFFRFYLLQKLKEWVPFTPVRLIFPVLLFALCHAYEGPWGMLNAVLAGLLLSIVFERYRALHGIAIAHAFYNVFVYIMMIFL